MYRNIKIYCFSIKFHTKSYLLLYIQVLKNMKISSLISLYTEYFNRNKKCKELKSLTLCTFHIRNFKLFNLKHFQKMFPGTGKFTNTSCFLQMAFYHHHDTIASFHTGFADYTLRLKS